MRTASYSRIIEERRPLDIRSAVGGHADVLRANKQSLFTLSWAPIKEGSLFINGPRLHLHDLADGALWDADGKQHGVVDYFKGEVRISSDLAKPGVALSFVYNYRRS